MRDELDGRWDRAAEDRLLRDMGLMGGQGRTAGDVRRDGSLGFVLLLVGLAIGAMIVAGGCGTVSGFGRDVSAVADGVRAEMAKD